MRKEGGRRRLAALLTAAALFGAAPALAADTAEEPAETGKTAIEATFPIYVDGNKAAIRGYIVEGNSYFGLRDLGEVTNFDVGWDAENRAIMIDTSPQHTNETELNDQLEKVRLENRALSEQSAQLYQIAESLRVYARWLPIVGAVAGLAVLITLGYVFAVRRRYVLPLHQVEAAVKQWPEEETEEFRERVFSIPGPLGSVLKSNMLRLQRTEEKYQTLLQAADRRGEEQAQDAITRQICDALLPQQSAGESGLASFVAASGYVHRGVRPDCVLYDYFPVDKNRMSFMVAQAPGHNAAAATLLTVVHVDIRSRLRAERSLAETLSEVNGQIYELRDPVPVSICVGILNAVSGSVSYINAGGTAPMLMRSGGAYEWQEGTVGTPLGQNANSDYRETKLSLRQGDRLFFYTDGLGEAANREGVRFREQEFRGAMNRSRDKTREPEELLRYVKAEAAAFCGQDEAVPGFAALLVEYRRGTKEFAYCTVRAQPSYAPEVAEFLKRRCGDYGIAPKVYARLMVVADELFAFCCRRSIRDDVCRVECSLAPDGQMVCVKMIAALGGKNPLENVRETVDVNAAAFIRENTEYVKFEPGEERDTISVIYALEVRPVPSTEVQA